MSVPPQQLPATPAEVTTFANDLHAYLRQNITWADQKSAFIFTVCSAVLAYLNSQGAVGLWQSPSQPLPIRLTGNVAAIVLAAAAVAALLTNWPRTKGLKSGFVFWDAVARFATAQSYADSVQSKTAAELAAEKLRHAHELARICARKFACTDAAMKLAAAGLIAAAVRIVAF